MLTYIIRRLVLIVPTLIGSTFILFAIMRSAPGLTSGGAFNQEGSLQSTEQRKEKELSEKRKLHLIDDKGNPIPLPKQYVLWVYDVVRWDLGDSAKQQGVRVSDLIAEKLPRTLAINFFQFLIVYVVAIPAGMLAAAMRGKTFDVVWNYTTLFLYCLPVIVVGMLSIAIFANPNLPKLHWFPAGQLHSVGSSDWNFFAYVRDYLWHLVLPVIVGSYGGFTYLSKMMRGATLDNLFQDYARTARAKGLSGLTVMTRHVFRNSLLPMITIFAGVLPGLLAGSVIIEYIFSIDGMGRLALEAAKQRDLPVLQALGVIGGIIGLLSILIRDICYAIADPRVSYD